ncbi:MAG: elongation factor 4 [Spirochaetes bacterium]|nr:MAG: elongation factor 4 [Spirochaetota bacterium]
MTKNLELIRNFSIVAHIDHGKSTLADRFLEVAGLLNPRNENVEQVLDSMDIERERGITIKSHPVTLYYKHKDGKKYTLNLIDTPGHVDFTYEVSRALAACEGVILLIDATQGIEAQTLSNFYMALEHDLTIIPVINKIDLPAADIENTKNQIVKELGFEREEIISISAKEGIGTEDVLSAIIERIPPPAGRVNEPLKALIFDSHFDSYRGVVVNVRLFDGKVTKGQRIKLMAANREYNVEEVGVFTPDMKPIEELSAGEVGYIIAGIKDISTTRVGDTVTDAINGVDKPLPGYREVKPMVFSSIYPVASDDYENLAVALEKLKLNDASLLFEKESSAALGFGFRCGFLGLLHLEVVQERLEREFGLSLVVTAPSVEYRVYYKDGTMKVVDNPVNFPDIGKYEYAEEPYVKASIITPEEYVGNIIKIAQQRNGIQKSMTYITEKRVELIYEMPLAEIIYDFHDKLKSVTRGYASLDYEFLDYRRSELVRLDILISGKPVDALSQIVRKDKAYQRGREIVKALKEEIPKHLFKIAIQAAIGSKIIARETIGAISKNVLAKCYGGDVTRKRKLLEKQKEGKKRMKKIGNVEIPQRAFVSVLKTRD